MKKYLAEGIKESKDLQMDKSDERILRILQNEDAEKTEKNLAKYMDYLEKNLSYPCVLTGVEDFNWEEFYIFGPGDKEEYEKLKKTKPSYTDRFELLKLLEEVDLILGIIAKVKRCSDEKIFMIPLADLKAADRKSENYKLLHDFSVWIVNY